MTQGAGWSLEKSGIGLKDSGKCQVPKGKRSAVLEPRNTGILENPEAEALTVHAV